MNNNRLSLVLIFICIVFSCSTPSTSLDSIVPNIVPVPMKQKMKEGQFSMSSKTRLNYNEDFKISARFLESYLTNGNQMKLNEGEGGNVISFEKDEQMENAEGYKLVVSSEEIKIIAPTDQGAFYAVQSLRQLLPVSFETGSYKGSEVGIKCMEIEDEPQFSYRGMHLDVGRHFFSTTFIKQYIDALAMLKMNTFHWHLTEDQGWRIEIKKYPRLNEIAAYRKETLVGHYNDQPHQFDGKRYGGFYTQEEIKDIVEYAYNRNVTIIPEIEMPGHSQAAIAAYPELGCTDEPIEVATKWGVFEEIYCTKEETFAFVEDVLDEVLTLFPSKYIHIGGDEAPKTRWKNCSDCQRRIKEEGLKDEHELQSYFISRVEKYLNGKGRQIIGWDEILEGGLAPNATVMSWRGTKGAVAAAKERHNVINTTTSHCYFDYYQSTNEGEPIAIGGFLPLEKVYGFNPIPEELNEDEQKYVLGAQGNVWTEYMSTEDNVEYMVYPRIMAMSEVVWSKDENKDYDDFVSRVEKFNERLDVLDVNYANHIYEVGGELHTEGVIQSFALKTVTKDKDIRYTTDGSDPNILSQIYKEPIAMTKSMVIKAAVFNAEKQLGGLFKQEFKYHKAVGKKLTLNVQPNKTYGGRGEKGLINGINGSNARFGDKEWLGFWGDDLEITIDLGEITEIKSIETRFHNANGQWVYAPKTMEILFDKDDGIPSVIILDSNELIVKAKLEKIAKSRYITLKVPSFGIIPEGSQGAGSKAWTFIDEIVVN